MSSPAARDSRLKAWILFVAGLVFLVKFAFWSPTALNPLLTSLIAGCLFGPSVFSLWRRDEDE